MFTKLKKKYQTPAELETASENIVEVVPQTQTETVANKLTKSETRRPSIQPIFNKPKLQINESENLNNSENNILKYVSDHNDAKESNKDVENNSTIRKSSELFLEKSRKFKRHEPIAKYQRKSGNLATDSLRKMQNKSPVGSKESTIQFISTSIFNESAVIDEQLSAKGRFKKGKCAYAIPNNERIDLLRKHAQDAVKRNKVFTIRGNYNSVRQALKSRGWVEKLETHRKSAPFNASHIGSICDLSQVLPKRKVGETQRKFVAKLERNIISRCIENIMCDFLWTPHKEKSDYLEQTKNPNMLINKFSRAPFTNKENLNTFLRDIPAFYEDGVADIKFPRCFNVWSPEELCEFMDNFKLTACISYIHWLVSKYNGDGFHAVFSPTGKIPFNSIDFAYKRCLEYIDACKHNDIDIEDPAHIWEHDWDSFLNQCHQMVNDSFKVLTDSEKLAETVITRGSHILENIRCHWPQHSIDGYQNLWIIKPANKCRGRGIHLSNNLKKILNFVNPSTSTKSHFVVQKYLERPLIIYQTKFDIRQWFLISSINPLMIWMYKECYLRFSTQEFTLSNHHESVHLTNHAIQKKYTNNGKRDTRLPNENMWDSYSFQAYLRQIGKQELWLERIYPGMRKAITAAVLVSQDQMERTSNSFELFGADFMICENFYPWLIEINSNPDLAATTSVTARMCPQCLEDVVKVMIDRRNDAKADVGSFELIYRQNTPPTPAYMGLSLVVKGKQITNRTNGHIVYQRRGKSQQGSKFFKEKSSLTGSLVSEVHKPMPAFDATEYIEKYMNGISPKSAYSKSGKSTASLTRFASIQKRSKSFNNQIMGNCRDKMSCPKSTYCQLIYSTTKRHRSCGPRLSINWFSDSKNAPKPKSLLSFRKLTVSKSDNNIKESCSLPKPSLQSMKSSSSTATIKQNTNNFKYYLGCRSNVKSEKEDNNTNNMHAIGTSICCWSANRALDYTKANV